ncbi:hypothetical protein CA85_03930 [Allorhodopirellula solitaria]|uniref:Uncharacterized protein n=1 Tax=Allorhodopirellula solitaria TaxID=2527987 RepID=A0A5C5YJN8_9BACT|nr:hypothetical protein CA85_03930 [Allorhodopirellula solitaria]
MRTDHSREMPVQIHSNVMFVASSVHVTNPVQGQQDERSLDNATSEAVGWSEHCYGAQNGPRVATDGL